MPKLKRWMVFAGGCLLGRVYDDKRYDPLTTEFEDGHRVVTSPIKIMAEDKSYAITESGTKYELGEEVILIEDI